MESTSKTPSELEDNLKNMRLSIDRHDRALLEMLGDAVGTFEQIPVELHIEASEQVLRHEASQELMAELLTLARGVIQRISAYATDKKLENQSTVKIEHTYDAIELATIRIQALVMILLSRFAVVAEIAKIKSGHETQPLDPKRWQTVQDNLRYMSVNLNLDPSFVLDLYDFIHRQSVIFQQKLLSERFAQNF